MHRGFLSPKFRSVFVEYLLSFQRRGVPPYVPFCDVSWSSSFIFHHQFFSPIERFGPPLPRCSGFTSFLGAPLVVSASTAGGVFSPFKAGSWLAPSFFPWYGG